MSWTEGFHCKTKDQLPNTNEELAKIEGEITTREAQAALARFCYANPGVAGKLLLGIDLYEIQDLIIKAMFQKDFFLAVCGRGFGKTSMYNLDTKVIEKFRGLVSLPDLIPNLEFRDKEYIKEIEPLYLWNGNSYQKTSKILVQGGKDSADVKSRMGFNLQGSTNHKIKVLDKAKGEIVWKRYHELDKLNDFICLSNGQTPLPEIQPEPSELDEAYLIGLIIGDGCLTCGDGISITSIDEQILKFLERFPCGKRGDKQKTEAKDIRLFSHFSRYLRQKYTLESKLSYDKTIPPLILQNKYLLKEFLSGLFDTDGGTEMGGQGVTFCSASKELAQQVHLSLLNFGIVSRLREKKTKSTFGKAWIVSMYSHESLKFYERIGFRLTRKQAGITYFSNKKLNSNVDVIYGALDIMREVNRAAKLIKARGDNSRFFIKPTRSRKEAGRDFVNEFVKFYDSLGYTDENLEKLRTLAAAPYFFDSIESIEYSNVDCIDFCDIPDGACYWSNGFISHNSTLAAVFVPLYALFNPGVTIIIASITFRQSRRIFEAIEKFIYSEGGAFIRECLTLPPKHESEGWKMEINGSTILALPLGSGEKIRGYRANVLLIDELLLLPKRIIEEVLKPFMAIQSDPKARQEIRDAETYLISKGKMTEKERTVFQNNKIIGLTSASYTFDYLYELYSDYKNAILDENAKGVSHCVMQMSCDMAPEGLYDKTIVEDARRNASKAQFDREYMAQFTGDSAGFFPASALENATLGFGENPKARIYGDHNKNYILAIDPNYDSSETSDHFAITVLELDEINRTGTMVHGYAVAAATIKQRINYIKYLFTNFNIVYVIVDRAAGEKFIKDVNDLDGLPFKLGFFNGDIDFNNPKEIIEMAQDYDLSQKKIVHCQQFAASWIRVANESLQGSVESKKIQFASNVDPDGVSFKDSDLGDFIFTDAQDKYKENTREGKSMMMKDFVDNQNYIISLTKQECSLIECSSNTNGVAQFDLPKNLKNQTGPNKTRKDSYSSLLLANWGLFCYYLMKDNVQQKKKGFIPRFLGK